jgi:hypothetical protein
MEIRHSIGNVQGDRQIFIVPRVVRKKGKERSALAKLIGETEASTGEGKEKEKLVP